MTPYIQLENISKWFGDFLLYEGLNLTVGAGQRIALIAKNGAGKTTLLNIIAGRDTPDSGQITFQNDITFGYLAQEPQINQSLTVMEAIYHSDNQIANITRQYEHAILHNDTDALEQLVGQMDSLGAWSFESRAKAILTQFKISDLDQQVGQLSGGQLKRLALAILLIDDPDILIMDEPTNHLDLDMVEWLEDYLIKSNKTILLVTHDRYFLDRICTDIYEIDHRQMYAYEGGYSDYLMKRDERISLFNSEVNKAQNLFRRELEWMRRMPQARGTKAKYRKDAFYETKDKASQKRTDENVKINIRASRLGTKIFEAKGVNKSFGDLTILRDFSYIFARYEKLGIIGRNGTGKSTFLNILTGAMPPDSGIVDIGDSVRFGYYRQSGMSFDEGKKVIEVVQDIAEVVTLGDGSTVSVSQFLNHFLFPPEVQYSYVAKLSGGERRRLYLLTILMQSPNFLILDEPTNDLDIMTLNVLEEYLDSFDGCLIVVSHDRYFMDKVVDHLFIFEGEGKIRNFAGNYTQYRNKLEEEHEADIAARAAAQAKAPTLAPKSASTENRPRKMTYAEKREFEGLMAEIEALETEKSELEVAMSSGNLDNDTLMAKADRIAEVIDAIDAKSLRWLELSEL